MRAVKMIGCDMMTIEPINKLTRQNDRRARVLENHNGVNRVQNALNAARNNADNFVPETNFLGEFNILCPHCASLKFQKEKVFKCCHPGKVNFMSLTFYTQISINEPQIILLITVNLYT